MPEPLVDALIELHRHLADREPIDATLQRITAGALRSVDGCVACSLTLHERGIYRTTAESSATAREVDEAQYASDAGPCLTAHRTGETIAVRDMARAGQWPEFRDKALAVGFGCSMSVPLTVGTERFGALNMYGTQVDAMDHASHDAATTLGHQASIALSNVVSFNQLHDLTDQLREAMDSRDVIGQAKGILMHARRITDDEAFALLSSTSQRRNLKVRELADEVRRTGALEDVAGL
ncbi:MAG TPA: GAF and ANTAR domain-containing protein [Acidimicrobiales bacterium]